MLSNQEGAAPDTRVQAAGKTPWNLMRGGQKREGALAVGHASVFRLAGVGNDLKKLDKAAKELRTERKRSGT